MDLKTHFKTTFEASSSSHSSQNPLAPSDASPEFNCHANDIIDALAMENYKTRIGNINARRLARQELHTIFSSWYDFTKRFERLPTGSQRDEEPQAASRQHNPSAEAFRLFDSQQDASPSQSLQSKLLLDTQEQPSPSEDSASETQFDAQEERSVPSQLLNTQQLNRGDAVTGYGAPEEVVAPTSPERSKNEWKEDRVLKGAARTSLERMAACVGRRSRVGSCWYCFKQWLHQVGESKRLFLIADAIVLRWDTFTCYNVIAAWQAKCLVERHMRWVFRMVSSKSWRSCLYFHFHGWHNVIAERLEEELAIRLRDRVEEGKETTPVKKRVVTKEDAGPLRNGKKPSLPSANPSNGTGETVAISKRERGIPGKEGEKEGEKEGDYDTVFISGLWNLSAFKSEDGKGFGLGAEDLSWGAHCEADKDTKSQRKQSEGAKQDKMMNGTNSRPRQEESFDFSNLWNLSSLIPGSNAEEGKNSRKSGKALPPPPMNRTMSIPSSEAIQEKEGADYDTVLISGVWNLSAFMGPATEDHRSVSAQAVSETLSKEGGGEGCDREGGRTSNGGPILWQANSHGNRIALF